MFVESLSVDQLMLCSVRIMHSSLRSRDLSVAHSVNENHSFYLKNRGYIEGTLVVACAVELNEQGNVRRLRPVLVGESKVVFSTTRADRAGESPAGTTYVRPGPSTPLTSSSSLVVRSSPHARTSFTFLRTRAAVQAVLREAGR